jgi:DNA polymerase-3 subunit alpha/error-prone DNA polymerase
LGIRPEQLPMLFHPIWKSKLDKMVVLQPVTFRTKKEFNLHKILRAIDSNVILSKLTETDYCRTSETMVPLKELLEKFSDHPKIIENTECHCRM